LSAGSPFFNFHSAVDVAGIIHRNAVQRLASKPGQLVNFLGVATDPKFFPGILDGRGGEVEGLPIPANWHADMAEWAAVLRAVELAEDTFTIVELGCGWGCWMNNAGTVAKRRCLVVQLVGVEGDEDHIQFAREALATNGFAESEVTLYHGIASADTGFALFPRQAVPGVSWGSEPVIGASEDEIRRAMEQGTFDILPMCSLEEISERHGRIDLLHIDIQGGEAKLIESCLPTITRKVAYMFVGSHSRQIEGLIMDLMLNAGWKLEIERPAIFNLDQSGIPSLVVDGVQAWRNPALFGGC
jgi:hypothetical protein